MVLIVLIDYCRSFPHSLLSTSKIVQRIVDFICAPRLRPLSDVVLPQKPQPKDPLTSLALQTEFPFSCRSEICFDQTDEWKDRTGMKPSIMASQGNSSSIMASPCLCRKKFTSDPSDPSDPSPGGIALVASLIFFYTSTPSSEVFGVSADSLGSPCLVQNYW